MLLQLASAGICLGGAAPAPRPRPLPSPCTAPRHILAHPGPFGETRPQPFLREQSWVIPEGSQAPARQSTGLKERDVRARYSLGVLFAFCGPISFLYHLTVNSIITISKEHQQVFQEGFEWSVSVGVRITRKIGACQTLEILLSPNKEVIITIAIKAQKETVSLSGRHSSPTEKQSIQHLSLKAVCTTLPCGQNPQCLSCWRIKTHSRSAVPSPGLSQNLLGAGYEANS